MRSSLAVMVIGATVVSAPLVSTELLDSVVLIEMFVAEVVSVIAEVIVVIGVITFNLLLATTTAIVAIKHPSKHNAY